MANAAKGATITITFQEGVGFIETLNELFGSGAGVILYHVGRGIGKAMTLGLEKAVLKDPEEGMRSFAKSLSERGWCEIEFSRVDPNDGSTVFRVKRPPVPNSAQDSYEMIIRGICSGFLEELWGTPVSVLRRKSKSDGFELIATRGGVTE